MLAEITIMTKIQLGRGLLLTLCLATSLAIAGEQASVTSKPQVIDFWNGNKTAARQAYERDILEAVLKATESSHGPWRIQESRADYPKAEDEASVFRSKGHHLFVTVAGNKKLENEAKIVIPTPIMKGLLGYRIPIIGESDRAMFAKVNTEDDLRKLGLGIPETWADADLFRHNGYKVVERGDFDTLFERLARGEFDYVAFGANEVAGVFEDRAKQVGDLIVEPTLLLYYPFPLLIYVNPQEPELADRIGTGLNRIVDNGVLDRIFTSYYGDVVDQLNLKKRQLIVLENPLLPASMPPMNPDLAK
jgi:hypothetical protein